MEAREKAVERKDGALPYSMHKKDVGADDEEIALTCERTLKSKVQLKIISSRQIQV